MVAANVQNTTNPTSTPRFRGLESQPGATYNRAVRHGGAYLADAFDDAGSALKRTVVEGFKRRFGEAAKSKEGFHRIMRQVFHRGYDRQAAEDFRRRALDGDYSWLPPVKLVDRATLQGANGAYDAAAGVVYLRRDLPPALAVATYVEETGHHLDTRLNAADTPGDEGEMLRRVLGGEKLSEARINDIRSENDHGVINVNGRRINVEFFSFKKMFKKIGRGIKKVVKGVGRGIKKVGNFISRGVKKVVKGVGRGIKKVGNFISRGVKKVGGFLKKVGSSILKVLNKLSPFAPLLNLIPGIGTALYAAFNAVKAVAGLMTGKFKNVFGSIISGLTGGLGGALGGVLGKVVGFGSRFLKGGALGSILNFGTRFIGGTSVGGVLGGVARFLGVSPTGGLLGRLGSTLGRTPLGRAIQGTIGLFGRNPLERLIDRVARMLRRTPVGRFIQKVMNGIERFRRRYGDVAGRLLSLMLPQSLVSRAVALLKL